MGSSRTQDPMACVIVDDLKLTPQQILQFQDIVWSQGDALYRDLPWRNTQDPYGVWISEVMLQQTQVPRVLGRWERFMQRFPTLDALASASSADVVEEWQGMGYNRRALALHKVATYCSEHYAGALPSQYDQLLALPGIGPSTAAGILAFAYDTPALYIETNVRSVIIHHFFAEEDSVSDTKIRMIACQVCPDHDVRRWYYALLDYGAQLKKDVVNPSRKAQVYTKQSAFEGSRRQKRAWLLREVMATQPVEASQLHARLNTFELSQGRDRVEDAEFQNIMTTLVKDGFFYEKDQRFYL